MAYFSLSPRGFSSAPPVFTSHQRPTQIPNRSGTDEHQSRFYLLGGSWVKSTATITCKTDAFYILCSMVYVQVAVVANFSHVHQMFQASSIVDILLDMSAVHETTKSKMITKFTGLRNVVIFLSRLFALQLFVCQCMQR